LANFTAIDASLEIIVFAVGAIALDKIMPKMRASFLLADPRLVGDGPAAACANIVFHTSIITNDQT
jgi:hypothetical protein